MKHTIAMILCAVAAAASAIDRFTITRLEAKANERRIVARSVYVDPAGTTNSVTTYRQSGVEWSVTNKVKVFTGVIATKRYSRLSLYLACVKAGLWEKLETWLKSQNVNGANAYTAFMLATEIREDDPIFIPMLGSASAALGVDEATIAALLKASEM